MEIDNQPPEPAAQPDASPAKRPIENGGEEVSKKPRIEEAKNDVECGGELRRVAEIVMVLSTMGAMRGGKKPSDVEVELMKEARTKLVELCKELAPQDIIAREAVSNVIEDLGLNARLKDHNRLGFQPPKFSISERFSLSKLKVYFLLYSCSM